MFAEFVARMEDTRLPKCVMFGRLVGGAGCAGGQEKKWAEYFLDDVRAFGRDQRRPVNDCSPGRGKMAQNGRTRGGTFYGKTDRCRESQSWTTACSRMHERHGKDQEDDSPKQATSC